MLVSAAATDHREPDYDPSASCSSVYCKGFERDSVLFRWGSVVVKALAKSLPGKVLDDGTLFQTDLWSTVVEFDSEYQGHTEGWNACGPGNLCSCQQMYNDNLVIECNGRFMIEVPTLPTAVHYREYNTVKVNLHKNNLTSIPDGWFDHIDKLYTLDLRHNELETVPVVTHETLGHFDLRYNKIRVIKAGVFSGVPNLEDLDLRHNSLQTIEEGALSLFTNSQEVKLDNAQTFANNLLPSSFGGGSTTRSNTPQHTTQTIASRVTSVAMGTTSYNAYTAYNTTVTKSAASDGGDTGGSAVPVIVACVAGVLLLAVVAVGIVCTQRRARSGRQQRQAASKHQGLVSEVKRHAWSEFVGKFGNIFLQERKQTHADDLKTRAQFHGTEVEAKQIVIRDLQGTCQFGKRCFGSLIGPGNGTHRENRSTARAQQDVVVTCCDKENVETMKAFLIRAHLLCSLSHENILRVAGVVTTNMPMMIATRRMVNGDLKQFLRNCRPTAQHQREVLDAQALTEIALQVVNGCEFLESRKVVHRALMAENILVGKNHNEICISGLGTIRDISVYEEYVKLTSTPDNELDIRWLAPELLLAAKTFTVKSDVWSFGVCLWEIWTFAKTPYYGMSTREIKEQIEEGAHLTKPKDCPDFIYWAMKGCWRSSPAARPTFTHLRGSILMTTMPECEQLHQDVTSITSWDKKEKGSWHIPSDKWQLVSRLELGTFTSAEYNTGEPHDMVAVSAGSLNDAEARHLFNAVQFIQHSHIVELLGHSCEGHPFEHYFKKPSLGSLVPLLRDGMIPPDKALSIAVSMAQGIEYLHSRNMAHGQLSPHVYYLDANHSPKLILNVLGNAARQADPTLCTAAKGCQVRWLAIETILTGDVSTATDVYAFALLMWQLSRPTSVPFGDLTEAAFEEHVKQTRACPALPGLGGTMQKRPDVALVFEACRQEAPAQRPAMSGVVDILLDDIHGADRWEVPREQLVRLETLGQGEFGEVFKMVTDCFSASGEYTFVAVKNLLPTDEDEQAQAQRADDFVQEIELMKRLRHPNLVSLLGVCMETEPYLIVLEFSTGGSLDTWLPGNGPKLELLELTHILHQVALGLAALNYANVIHRDLAARNVLIGDALATKIADYGMSRDVTAERDYYRVQNLSRPLPVRWCAPEVLSELLFSVDSDVYSFGVLIFEVFSFGEYPFGAINDQDFIAFLSNSSEPLHARLAFHPRAPAAPVVESIMQQALSRDRRHRYVYRALLLLPFARSPFPCPGECSCSSVHAVELARTC